MAKMTIRWECKNTLCNLIRVDTEALVGDYSEDEINVAECPNCHEMTLVKVQEILNVNPYEE